jgi:hypothetical protein
MNREVPFLLDSATVAELYAAMDSNLATHMSWVQARLPGARVIEAPDLMLVDSGLATDTFNVICRARLAPETLQVRIAEALAFFQEFDRPFSWWVGPSDQPEGLGQALSQAGLVAAEEEVGMGAPLMELAPVETAPHGLRIERATQPSQVTDFARIVAANWSPPDLTVLAYYTAAASLILDSDSPIRLRWLSGGAPGGSGGIMPGRRGGGSLQYLYPGDRAAQGVWNGPDRATAPGCAR